MTEKISKTMMICTADKKDKKNKKPMDKKKKHRIIIIASTAASSHRGMGLAIAFAAGSLRRRGDRGAGLQEHDVRRRLRDAAKEYDHKSQERRSRSSARTSRRG